MKNRLKKDETGAYLGDIFLKFTAGWLGYNGDEVLASYIPGLGHYKDPYQQTNI